MGPVKRFEFDLDFLDKDLAPPAEAKAVKERDGSVQPGEETTNQHRQKKTTQTSYQWIWVIGILLFIGFIVLLTKERDSGSNQTANKANYSQDSGKELQVSPDLSVVGSAFGVIELIEGKRKFHRSTEVPWIEGLSYGWVLRLKTTRESVNVREEFELPAAAKNWDTAGAGSKVKISKDRRSIVVEKTYSTNSKGFIYNFWSIAKGDPTGPYKIKVYLDNILVAVFDFHVTNFQTN